MSPLGVFVEVKARGPVNRLVLVSVPTLLASTLATLGFDRRGGNSALFFGNDDDVKGEVVLRGSGKSTGIRPVDNKLAGIGKVSDLNAWWELLLLAWIGTGTVSSLPRCLVKKVAFEAVIGVLGVLGGPL